MRSILFFKLLFVVFLTFVESYYIGNNGCNDMVRIPSASTINLPEKYASKFNEPWLNQKFKTRLFSSQTLAQNWRWFKNLKIQGIDSTFAEVLQILEENDCFFVGYGSGIKNILLGKIKEQSILKIEGETTCDSFKLNEICSKNFGSDNCHVVSVVAKNKIIFGNDRTSKDFNETLIEPISIFSWNSMLTTDRLKWGFTVNECGLLDNQSGDVFFIDFTTQSQMDICKHSVKIPVQPSYWKKWTNNNLIKILEVYNLVSDGFNVEEREYQFFIDFIKSNFNVVSFQEYFCTFLYGGKFYPWFVQTNTTKTQIQNRSQCHFLTLDSRRIRLLQKVNQTLQEDFGDFWKQNMTSSLIGMSLFEDKGKPRNPFMKMITVNQQSENNIKNGRTRTRNAVDEDETLHHFSSFQSTTNLQIPPSQTSSQDKTLQITLKVNCKENRVTIENQNSDVQNVHHSSISPQPFVATRENHFHPSIPTTTAKSSQVSSQQVTNVEKTHVLAQPVDDDPPPQKPHTKRGRYLLKSGTPNPNVRYYTKDEVDHVLAEDY